MRNEIFGGYPTYLGARFGELYARWPRPLRLATQRVVEAWPASDKKVALSFLLKRFVQGSDLDGVSRHLLWTTNLSPALMKRLGLPPHQFQVEDGLPRNLLDAVQQLDLKTSLAEGLLTKKDRGSMSSALELRSPFLDHQVMEFAASLPARERVRGLTTKVFLKRYALQYLPRSIVFRKKRGLSVPLSSWLRGSLYEWARSVLASSRLDQVGIRHGAALELLEEHRLRRADHGRALWTLLVLNVWLEWAEDRLSSPPPITSVPL